MKILLIGNGFDLDHGLPTKYIDFLNFVQRFNKLKKEERETIEVQLKDLPNKNLSLNILFANISIKKELEENVDNNLWINLFNNRTQLGENWIDFEKEIGNTIKALEKFKPELVEKKSFDDFSCDLKKLFSDFKLGACNTDKIYNGNLGFVSFRNDLIKDLIKLIKALEIYLSEYVEQININEFNPSILSLKPDKILSFNYTGTYKKNYSILNPNVDYDFVHGKTNRQNLGVPNNMVLGIDEYLDADTRNKNTDFIAFKKYYQRIQKKTDHKYFDWLDEIDKSKYSENELYVFGHSLDVTDKDILRKFLLNDKIKTTIYYCNRSVYATIIENLVKIISQDELIKRTQGKKANIFFMQQEKAKLIKGSEFEITEITYDIKKITQIHLLSTENAKKLIDKIIKKIEDQDLQYFSSQDKTITMFDVLQNISIDEKYKSKMLNIAKRLYLNTDGIEPVLINCNEWEEFDGFELQACSKKTSEFIDIVNDYNKKAFTEANNIQEELDGILKLRKYKHKSELSSEELKKMLDLFLSLFDEPNIDIHELWEIVNHVFLNNLLNSNECLTNYKIRTVSNDEIQFNEIRLSALGYSIREADKICQQCAEIENNDD